MIVLAIDPGCDHSALVIWDGASVLFHVDEPNVELIARIRGYLESPVGFPIEIGVSITGKPVVLVCEQIESFGMAVGKSTFETVWWAGRFAEAWFPKRSERVTRKAVKIWICGQTRARDAEIRQALIDRFGPTKDKAIGTKKQPGPLYQVTGHKLSALAVALTFYDLNIWKPEEIRSGVVGDF